MEVSQKALTQRCMQVRRSAFLWRESSSIPIFCSLVDANLVSKRTGGGHCLLLSEMNFEGWCVQMKISKTIKNRRQREHQANTMHRTINNRQSKTIGLRGHNILEAFIGRIWWACPWSNTLQIKLQYTIEIGRGRKRPIGYQSVLGVA